jgi:hypothetical protein
VDPLAEKYYSWTPYQYVRGNPILRIDPNGMYDAEAWEKKNREEFELFNLQSLGIIGWNQSNNPPEFNWGGSSSGKVNDELPPVLADEKGKISETSLDLHVEAVRTFLIHLGYDPDDVNRDVVVQEDPFFGNYYAKLKNPEKYIGTWSSGQRDSYSKTNNAYVSPSPAFMTTWIDRHGRTVYNISTYALKLYPERGGFSIGIINSGFVGHRIESSLEVIDGLFRNTFGKDNMIYDMHGRNVRMYLRNRDSFH